MSRTYFKIFCEMIDNEDPLSTQTAMSFYHKLKIGILPELKSEINKKLIDLDSYSRTAYLEYLLQEIENQAYIKDAGIRYIQKHIDTYKVSLKSIVDFDLNALPHQFRFQVLDIHYKDMEPYSKEKDTAFLVQLDFMNYFCKLVADQLISFCENKIDGNKHNTNDRKPTGIKTQLLDNFHTYSGLDISEMHQYAYQRYSQQNLEKAIILLDKEIKNNLLLLDNSKLGIYFDQLIEMLKKSQFLSFDVARMNFYKEKYNLDLTSFPKVNNTKLAELLRLTGNPFNPLNGADYQKYFDAEKTQSDFYKYTAKLEITKFIEKVKTLQSKYLGVMKPVAENKQTYAKLYGYELSKYESIAIEHNYFTYYNILLGYISKVKEEVAQNILQLESIKIPFYLEKTITEIEGSNYQNQSETVLDKYVASYQVVVNKLPEVDNVELRRLLKTNDYYQKMPYHEFSEIEFIQGQFYLYGLRTETIKLLSYLKEIQSEYQTIKTAEVPAQKKYNSNLFKSQEAQQWFKDTLLELNAITANNCAKTGFQAKANAIYTNSDCKKVIFKYGSLLAEYIVYLNENFNGGIKHKDKLSIGANHEAKVTELIKIYQNL